VHGHLTEVTHAVFKFSRWLTYLLWVFLGSSLHRRHSNGSMESRAPNTTEAAVIAETASLGSSASPSGAMEPATLRFYAPSWRRMPLAVGLCFLFSWLCHKHSGSYDEVSQRTALAGCGFFASCGAILLCRQLCGRAKLLLTPDAPTHHPWRETRRFPWSRHSNFEAGASFGPMESISFTDTETGLTETLCNVTRLPSQALRRELWQWQEGRPYEP
jgi:hypothetical protein